MNSIGMPGAVRLMPGGDARPAAAEPGARIVGIAQPGNPLLAAPVDDVVVLRPLHEAPLLGEPVGPEAPRQARHVERTLVRLRWRCRSRRGWRSAGRR